VAKQLGSKISVHAVWRTLRREGIYLQRLRTWCVSSEPEFAPKAAEVVGLYLNPPLNALLLSVDEKPSIQAKERPSGYVETNSGALVRALKSTYKRHGTLNLCPALEVASGPVYAQTTAQKKREDFRAFLEAVLGDLPGDQEIHVMVDNDSTPKKNDDWRAQYVRKSPVSLHSDVRELAQPGRNLVFPADAQGPAWSQFQEQRRTAGGHRGLCAKTQSAPQALPLAQARGQGKWSRGHRNESKP
jgi:hypothetical protein